MATKLDAEANRRAAAEAARRRAAAEAARKAAAEAAKQAAAEAAANAAAKIARPIVKPAGDELSSGRGSALKARGLRASGATLLAGTLDSNAPKLTLAQVLSAQRSGAPVGRPPASTLATEVLGDGQANCLEQAVRAAKPGDRVLLYANQTNPVGHAVVQRPDGSVLDPTAPTRRYPSAEAFGASNPGLSRPVSLSDGQAERVLAAPPGAARDAVIEELGLDAIADRKVAGFTPPGATGEATEDGGSVSGTAGAGVSATRGPVSVGAGLEVEANFASEVTREDGKVTFSVRAEVSATLEGNLEVKARAVSASVGASHTEADSASYQVTLSEEDFERFQAGEIPVPSPTDPSTIPDGATLRLDTAQIRSDALNASVGYYGTELSLGSSANASEGTTVEVTRRGDQLQVATGPSAAFGTDISAGLAVGPIAVSAGNASSFERVELKTATFGIGSEAYGRYLNTGALPEENGDGVTHVGTVIREDYDSQSSAGASVGGHDAFRYDGASSTGTRTAFIGADGTTVEDLSFRYGGATLNVHNEYSENGKQYDDSHHALVFPQTDPALRYDLSLAFTGDEEEAQSLADQEGPIAVTFDLEQLANLRRRMQDLPEGTDLGTLGILAQARTNDALAVALAKVSGNDAFVGDLLRLSQALGEEQGRGYANLPGSVEVG